MRGILQLFVLIKFHHLIQITVRIIFLLLGERPTDDTNGNIGIAEENFVIIFSKGKAKILV